MLDHQVSCLNSLNKNSDYISILVSQLGLISFLGLKQSLVTFTSLNLSCLYSRRSQTLEVMTILKNEGNSEFFYLSLLNFRFNKQFSLQYETNSDPFFPFHSAYFAMICFFREKYCTLEKRIIAK